MAVSESVLVGAFSFVVHLLYFNYFRSVPESWRLWLTVAFFPIAFLPFYVLVSLLIAEDNASSGPVISELKSLVYGVAVGAALLFNYVKDRCVMVKKELSDRIVHAARFLADQLELAAENIMYYDDNEEHDRSDAVPKPVGDDAPRDSSDDEYYSDLDNDGESEFPIEDDAEYAAQSHEKDESNVETELQVEEKEDSSEGDSEERSNGVGDHEEEDGKGPTNGIGEEDDMSDDCGEESGYTDEHCTGSNKEEDGNNIDSEDEITSEEQESDAKDEGGSTGEEERVESVDTEIKSQRNLSGGHRESDCNSDASEEALAEKGNIISTEKPQETGVDSTEEDNEEWTILDLD